MDIKIFDNKILAPSKCGTRYLRKVFTDRRFNVNTDSIDGISHIVIRNPYEHFESAIHTEYLNYTDSIENIDHIICGVNSNDGIGHWHPKTYQFLYSVFLKNKNIEIVDLPNLSQLIESFGYSTPYEKSEYDWSSFPNWKPKELLIGELKLQFKNEFESVDSKLKIEFEYYTKLLNRDTISSII